MHVFHGQSFPYLMIPMKIKLPFYMNNFRLSQSSKLYTKSNLNFRLRKVVSKKEREIITS